jgi:hypothetical protein
MNIDLILKLLELAQAQKPTAPTTQTKQPSGQHIVVMDRGFVYVGNVTIDDEWVRIANARNIRVWGTAKGLGELRNGPTKDTKLDACGEVLAPRKALISLIPCSGF